MASVMLVVFAACRIRSRLRVTARVAERNSVVERMVRPVVSTRCLIRPVYGVSGFGEFAVVISRRRADGVASGCWAGGCCRRQRR